MPRRIAGVLCLFLLFIAKFRRADSRRKPFFGWPAAGFHGFAAGKSGSLNP